MLVFSLMYLQIITVKLNNDDTLTERSILQVKTIM